MIVLLPGFGGSADQPILKKIEKKVGRPCLRIAPPRLPLTPELTAYVDWLDAAVTEKSITLVGRSFGGRLAIRLAQRRKVEAIVLLGFPVRPPKKPRPLDEAALSALKCPTLIVQGTKDELGPMKVLSPIVAANTHIELKPLEGAGHSFGRKENEAIDLTVAWLGDRS